MPIFRVITYEKITKVYAVEADDEMEAVEIVYGGDEEPEDEDADDNYEVYELDEEEAALTRLGQSEEEEDDA